MKKLKLTWGMAFDLVRMRARANQGLVTAQAKKEAWRLKMAGIRRYNEVLSAGSSVDNVRGSPR